MYIINPPEVSASRLCRYNLSHCVFLVSESHLWGTHSLKRSWKTALKLESRVVMENRKKLEFESTVTKSRVSLWQKTSGHQPHSLFTRDFTFSCFCWRWPRRYLSDRSVLLQEHRTGSFQLQRGSTQQLQRLKADLKVRRVKTTRWVSSVSVRGKSFQEDLWDSQREARRAEVFPWASPLPVLMAARSACRGPPCSHCYCGSTQTSTSGLFSAKICRLLW